MNQTRRTILDEPTTETADYRSADVNVSAFLMARGFPLTRVEPSRVDSRRHVFVFPRECEAVAPTFFAGALITARAFANALRDLKSILHSQRF